MIPQEGLKSVELYGEGVRIPSLVDGSNNNYYDEPTNAIR